MTIPHRRLYLREALNTGGVVAVMRIEGIVHRELAEELGVSESLVSKVARGERWQGKTAQRVRRAIEQKLQIGKVF